MKFFNGFAKLWILATLAMLVLLSDGEARRIPRGRCPDTTGLITTCQFTEENCLSDAECGRLERCCPYGCGSRCQVPVIGWNRPY